MHFYFLNIWEARAPILLPAPPGTGSGTGWSWELQVNSALCQGTALAGRWMTSEKHSTWALRYGVLALHAASGPLSRCLPQQRTCCCTFSFPICYIKNKTFMRTVIWLEQTKLPQSCWSSIISCMCILFYQLNVSLNFSFRVFNELKTKILNIKKYKKKLLTALGEFLEDHFPLPDKSAKKKKVSSREDIPAENHFCSSARCKRTFSCVVQCHIQLPKCAIKQLLEN